MEGTLTLIDGRAYRIEADAILSISWADGVGPLFCSLAPIGLDFEDCRLANVQIDGHQGLCWEGEVRRQSVDGALECLGVHVRYGDSGAIRIACDTRVGDDVWRPRTTRLRHSGVEPSNAVASIVITHRQGVVFPESAFGGVYRWLPPTRQIRVKFDWTRYSTNYELRLRTMYRTSSGDVQEESAEHTPSAWAILSGSGALSGSADETITVTGSTPDIEGITLTSILVPGGTPAQDRHATFSNIRVYGIAEVPDSTPKQFLDYLLAEDPNRVIDDYGDAIEPLYFDRYESDADQIAEMNRYQASRFINLPRLVANDTVMAARYGQRPTDVRYRLDVSDPRVEYSEGLGGLDAEALANRAHVDYTQPDGRSRSLIRTATNALLARAGRIKDVFVDANATSSTSRAQSLGDLALDEANRDRTVGTLKTPYLFSASGNEVPLEHLECGVYVQLDGLPREVVGRLVEYEIENGLATISLDASPYELDIALARLDKRRN